MDYMHKLGVRKGCTVLIEKAGDVIPKVSQVLDYDKTIKEEENVCTHCPCELKQPLIKRMKDEDNQNDISELYCGYARCPEKLVFAVTHFASRDGMNIAGLGEATVRQLIANNLITELSDLYSLHQVRDKLEALDGWGKKKVSNLLNNIENSKSKPLHTFVYALGLPHVGKNVAKLLTDQFATFDGLVKVTADKVESIRGIGSTVSKALLESFQDSERRQALIKLYQAVYGKSK
jgi:DNA ligase (NAD+)